MKALCILFLWIFIYIPLVQVPPSAPVSVERLTIPSIGMDERVVPVGQVITERGATIAVPDNEVGWYQYSARRSLRHICSHHFRCCG
jgi:hypothetical protein